jgi:hypothetical protein
MSEVPVLSRRMLQKEGYSELADKQKEILKDLPVCVRHEAVNGPKFKPGDAKTILSIFFRQLFSPYGVFLDLRSLHFNHETDVLLWNPGVLWTKFAPEFREGLIEVYDGFYEGKDELYRSGLVKIGLLNLNWSLEDQNKIMEMFRKQFGADLANVAFKVEDLTNGIVSMAQFLLERKARIKKDFLYLGIYLVTMYGTLEETGESLPVKEIYLSSRNQRPLISVKS